MAESRTTLRTNERIDCEDTNSPLDTGKDACFTSEVRWQRNQQVGRSNLPVAGRPFDQDANSMLSKLLNY